MTEQLHCPECGHKTFSWIARQIEYGAIIEDNGIRQERDDRGGTHIEIEDNYQCRECHELWNRDDIARRDEQETL